MESVVEDLAAVQGTRFPEVRPAEALIFAADHPVCAHGVAPFPSEVTAAMVRNFASGGAAASVLCRQLGVPLHVIDVGVQAPVESGGDAACIVRVPNIQAGDLSLGQALPGDALPQSLSAGRDAVDRCGDDTRLLILGEMGIGNSTVAAALSSALMGFDPDLMVGPGTGASGAMLDRKKSVVRAAVQGTKGCDTTEILRAVGGREVAALVGAAQRAAERSIAVLVDGFIVSAAMLAAVQLDPKVRPYLFFAHRSREPGHGPVLKALSAEPLMDMGLALGEGSGALTAFPLLEMACRLHRDMATFESASVPTAGGPA